MKGISTEMVILIIAVIAGILILVFMWSQGMLPFLSGATESDCKTDLIKVCGNALRWSDIQDKDKSCYIYFVGTEKTNLQNCLNDPAGNIDACTNFCSAYLAG